MSAILTSYISIAQIVMLYQGGPMAQPVVHSS